MFDAAGKIWGKIQEFMKRIGDLEDDSDESKKEIAHLRRELAIMQKEHAHNDKILAHVSTTTAHLEQRVKRLESEKHSEATKAGIWKSKAQKAAKRPSKQQ